MWKTCCKNIHRVPWNEVRSIIESINRTLCPLSSNMMADDSTIFFYWTNPNQLSSLILSHVSILCDSGYQNLAEKVFSRCSQITLQTCYARFQAPFSCPPCGPQHAEGLDPSDPSLHPNHPKTETDPTLEVTHATDIEQQDSVSETNVSSAVVQVTATAMQTSTPVGDTPLKESTHAVDKPTHTGTHDTAEKNASSETVSPSKSVPASSLDISQPNILPDTKKWQKDDTSLQSAQSPLYEKKKEPLVSWRSRIKCIKKDRKPPPINVHSCVERKKTRAKPGGITKPKKKDYVLVPKSNDTRPVRYEAKKERDVSRGRRYKNKPPLERKWEKTRCKKVKVPKNNTSIRLKKTPKSKSTPRNTCKTDQKLKNTHRSPSPDPDSEPKRPFDATRSTITEPAVSESASTNQTHSSHADLDGASQHESDRPTFVPSSLNTMSDESRDASVGKGMSTETDTDSTHTTSTSHKELLTNPRMHAEISIKIDSVIYVTQYLMPLTDTGSTPGKKSNPPGQSVYQSPSSIIEQSIQTAATRHALAITTIKGDRKGPDDYEFKNENDTIKVWVPFDTRFTLNDPQNTRVFDEASRCASRTIVQDPRLDTDKDSKTHRVFRISIISYTIKTPLAKEINTSPIERKCALIHAYPGVWNAINACARCAWGDSNRKRIAKALHELIIACAAIGVYDQDVEIGTSVPECRIPAMELSMIPLTESIDKFHITQDSKTTPGSTKPVRVSRSVKRRKKKKKKKSKKGKRINPDTAKKAQNVGVDACCMSPAPQSNYFFYNGAAFDLQKIDSLTQLLQCIVRSMFYSNPEDAVFQIDHHMKASQLRKSINYDAFRRLLPVAHSSMSSFAESRSRTSKTTSKGPEYLAQISERFSNDMRCIQKAFPQWTTEQARIMSIFYDMPKHWMMESVADVVHEISKKIKVIAAVHDLGRQESLRRVGASKHSLGVKNTNVSGKGLKQASNYLLNIETIELLFERCALIGKKLLQSNFEDSPTCIQNKSASDALIIMISCVNTICGVIPEELCSTYVNKLSAGDDIRGRVDTVSKFFTSVSRGVRTACRSRKPWCTPSAYIYSVGVAANILNAGFRFCTDRLNDTLRQFAEMYLAASSEMNSISPGPTSKKSLTDRMNLLRLTKLYKIKPCQESVKTCRMIMIVCSLFPQRLFTGLTKLTNRQVQLIQGIRPDDDLHILRVSMLSFALEAIATLVARMRQDSKKGATSTVSRGINPSTTERKVRETKQNASNPINKDPLPKEYTRLIRVVVRKAIESCGIQFAKGVTDCELKPVTNTAAECKKWETEQTNWKNTLESVLSHVVELTVETFESKVSKHGWRPTPEIIALLIFTISCIPRSSVIQTKESRSCILESYNPRSRSRVIWASCMISKLICEGPEYIKMKEYAMLAVGRSVSVRSVVYQVIEGSWAAIEINRRYTGTHTDAMEETKVENHTFPSLKDIRFGGVVSMAHWAFLYISRILKPILGESDEKLNAYFSECVRSVKTFGYRLYQKWSNQTGMTNESNPIIDIFNAGNIFGSMVTRLVTVAWTFGAPFRTNPRLACATKDSKVSSKTSPIKKRAVGAASPFSISLEESQKIYKTVIQGYLNIKWNIDRGTVPIGNYMMPTSSDYFDQMNASLGSDTPCSVVHRALETIQTMNRYVRGFSFVRLPKAFVANWGGPEMNSDASNSTAQFVHQIMSPLVNSISARPRQAPNREVACHLMALLAGTIRRLALVYTDHPEWIVHSFHGTYTLPSKMKSALRGGGDLPMKKRIATVLGSQDYKLTVAAEGIRNLIFADNFVRFMNEIRSDKCVSANEVCILNYVNQSVYDIDQLSYTAEIKSFSNTFPSWNTKVKTFKQCVAQTAQRLIHAYVPEKSTDAEHFQWLKLCLNSESVGGSDATIMSGFHLWVTHAISRETDQIKDG